MSASMFVFGSGLTEFPKPVSRPERDSTDGVREVLAASQRAIQRRDNS